MTINVGEILRMIREARNEKLTDIAKKAGVSPPFLSLVEQGRRQPSLEVLNELAIALKVPLESIILASQQANGTMQSSDDQTRRIVESVKKLKSLQESLKRELDAHNVETTWFFSNYYW
jgi:transcriptional regulator with XRE-family HTH domain